MKALSSQFFKIMGLALCLTVFSACKSIDLDEHQMVGVLTVNKAALGNEYLELYDQDSDLARFIHPGRKILQIKKNMSSVDVIIMESGRAKLGRIHVPMDKVSGNENNFTIKGSEIEQDWDLKVQRIKVPLQVEHLQKKGSTQCGKGWSGEVWKVTDYRYDYIVRFMNNALAMDIARLTAQGEIRTEASSVDSERCLPLKQVFPAMDNKL